MATKFVANVGLFAAALAVVLGNYWYTYGLWPRSWWSFFGFGAVGILLMLLRQEIESEKR